MLNTKIFTVYPTIDLNHPFVDALRWSVRERLKKRINIQQAEVHYCLVSNYMFRKQAWRLRGHSHNTCIASPTENPKCFPGGPKRANVVWKGFYPQVFWCSRILLPNKFFDPRRHSMTGVCDGEKVVVEKK